MKQIVQLDINEYNEITDKLSKLEGLLQQIDSHCNDSMCYEAKKIVWEITKILD